MFSEIQVVTGLCRSHLSPRFVNPPWLDPGQIVDVRQSWVPVIAMRDPVKGLADLPLPQGRLTQLCARTSAITVYEDRM